MKTLNKFKLGLILIITFIVMNATFSNIELLPTEEASNCALQNAKTIWGENVQINNGVIFTNLKNEPTAYVFAIYKKKGDFPSDSEINLQIEQGRNLRIEGERLLEISQEANDYKGIEEALEIIDKGWKQMLDEDNFGTVVVSDISGVCKPVEMYDGLPLNYVTNLDGYDLAIIKLGEKNLQFSRFLFNGLFEYFAEFKNSSENVFVNLKFLEICENKPTRQDFNLKNNILKLNDVKESTMGIKKPAIQPYETKLWGIPDYQSYGHRCAEFAAGNILGYWDHRGYPLLVEGGTKYTAGHTDPNGYGYLHLCVDELCATMRYFGDTWVDMIDNGIRELCNDPSWGRNYSFQSVDRGWHSPESDYNFIQGEIGSSRPMVYTLRYHLWGGGSGYHSVSLIGHGATHIHYYYICHDVNSTTGTTVYLFWEEFMSNACIHTVVPGGSSYANNLNNPSPILISAINKPNPFNPETDIRFQISKPVLVKINIYNTLGEYVCTLFDGFQDTGDHTIHWDGRDKVGNTVSSGTYFFVITSGQEKISKKMVLIR